MSDVIETVFGVYSATSKGRLDLTYDYETSTIYAFKRILQEIEAHALVDVGANIGVYSVFCSDSPSLKEIHAFDPAPASYSLLAQNASLQRRDRVKIQTHQIAASSTVSVVPFQIVAPTSGANSVVGEKEAGKDYIDVDARPLDDVIKIRNRRLAVKIDVEGHEAEAIRGMTSLLRENDCYIQVEALREARIKEVRELLESFGYEYVFSLRDDHLFLHNNLAGHTKNILSIIAASLHHDLRDLMHLRREKRSAAVAARKLREQIMYNKDPLFLPQEANPF